MDVWRQLLCAVHCGCGEMNKALSLLRNVLYILYTVTPYLRLSIVSATLGETMYNETGFTRG